MLCSRSKRVVFSDVESRLVGGVAGVDGLLRVHVCLLKFRRNTSGTFFGVIVIEPMSFHALFS